MEAIVFDHFGTADVLQFTNVPKPEIRPNDLLVKVAAAGVNRADLLQREGMTVDVEVPRQFEAKGEASYLSHRYPV